MIIMRYEATAMVRVVNHLEIKNPAIAPDLNVGLAGVVEDCGEDEGGRRKRAEGKLVKARGQTPKQGRVVSNDY